MTAFLVVLGIVSGAIVVAFAARRVSGAFSELSGALRSPSQVPVDRFEALVETVNRLEREMARLPDEWMEAALEAEAERTRVEQTLKRAWDRVKRGEDGESAIEAEALRHGVSDAEGGEEEGVFPMHQSVDLRGKGGIRTASQAKWSGMI